MRFITGLMCRCVEHNFFIIIILGHVHQLLEIAIFFIQYFEFIIYDHHYNRLSDQQYCCFFLGQAMRLTLL